MNLDVVIANKNIKKLITAVKKYEYTDAIVLVKSLPKEFNDIKKKNPEIKLGVLFEPKSLSDFDKLKKYKESAIILGKATDEKLLRRILEHKKINGFVGVEDEKKREHTHYRRSNMNQVLAKIAKENNKTYYVDFGMLLNSKKKSKLIGRVMQNVKFLRKYRAKMSIASFSENENGIRLEDNLASVAKVLGVRKLTPVSIPQKEILPKGVRIVG